MKRWRRPLAWALLAVAAAWLVWFLDPTRAPAKPAAAFAVAAAGRPSA